MDFELAKVLAGLGGIVAGVGVLINWIATLVGAILIYLGLSEYARQLGDSTARDNATRWLIYVAFASVAFTVAYSALGFSLFSLHSLWTWPLAGVAFVVAAAAWVAGWVLQVASAYRVRLLLGPLARSTGEGLFRTADTLYWWGSALTIVVIGVVPLFVAYILMGIAFLTASPPGAPAEATGRGVASPPSTPLSAQLAPPRLP